MSQRKIKFSERRAKWAEPRKNVSFSGSPLRNNVSIEEKSAAEYERLAKQMVEEVKREIAKLFMSDDAEAYFAMDANIAVSSRVMLNKLTSKYKKYFNSRAQELVDRMLTRVNKESEVVVKKSLKELSGGVTIKVDKMPAKMEEIISASINENVDLIKSIPEEYLNKVKGAVMRSIQSGGMETLVSDIEKIGSTTKRRARNIAIDQTRKLYNSMNIERAKSAGVTQGKWLHTGGSKEPRKKHVDYSGKLFDLDKGAPIGNNGKYVMPGEEPYCRCTFVPVINFGEE